MCEGLDALLVRHEFESAHFGLLVKCTVSRAEINIDLNCLPEESENKHKLFWSYGFDTAYVYKDEKPAFYVSMRTHKKYRSFGAHLCQSTVTVEQCRTFSTFFVENLSSSVKDY